MSSAAPSSREAPESRRARIVEEAVRVIGQRGSYGFTIQELAQRCGLSNAGLLYHFGSREQILLEVLRDAEARETAFFSPLVMAAEQAASGEPSRKAVLTVLRAMVARVSAQPELVQLFGVLQAETIDHGHPAHAWRQTRDAVLLDFLARLVGPHVADPEMTARLLVCLMDGLAQHWLRMDRSFDLAAAWDRALSIHLPDPAPRNRAVG